MNAYIELHCPHCHQKNRIPADRLGDGPCCGQCKKPILSGVIEANSELLAQLMQQATLPVLVDFWAPWCGPCRSFAPVFKAAAENHGGKILFVKVDTQAHPIPAQHYGIRSIPTLIAFSKGSEIQRVSGALPPADLEKWVKHLEINHV